MYTSTYTFYLIKGSTIDYEIAIQLWKLYFNPQKKPQNDKFVYYNDFIEYCFTTNKKPIKVHKDLWKMVYEFVKTIINVDQVKEDDGWPVFLDDFAEYIKEKYKQAHIL